VIDLHIESWGPGDAPALLYLHGGPGQSSYEFEQLQAARLVGPLRLVTFDQRGVLRSPPLGPDDSVTLDDLVADCEAIRTDLGIERWTILGQSFGGMVALKYAVRHPAAVAAVAFENPCFDVDRTCRSLLSAFVAHPSAGAHPEAAAAAAALLATDADVQALWGMLVATLRAWGDDRDEIYVPDEKVRARISELLAAAPFSPAQWGQGGEHLMRLSADPDVFAPHTPLLRQITQPTMLIKGGADPIPSAGEVADFRQALPLAPVHVFAGAGHYVQAERPGEYADLVTAFVLGAVPGA
jgi:proline iminopeptidase